MYTQQGPGCPKELGIHRIGVVGFKALIPALHLQSAGVITGIDHLSTPHR